ncbi:hypothetical protein K456DRAFT_31577 [Colletotrichum gloeosporioides 23]|nr:hypothetical protein K456DRAFT_31577 [Colletotrichum gloeosporioides 23]
MLLLLLLLRKVPSGVNANGCRQLPQQSNTRSKLYCSSSIGLPPVIQDPVIKRPIRTTAVHHQTGPPTRNMDLGHTLTASGTSPETSVFCASFLPQPCQHCQRYLEPPQLSSSLVSSPGPPRPIEASPELVTPHHGPHRSSVPRRPLHSLHLVRLQYPPSGCCHHRLRDPVAREYKPMIALLSLLVYRLHPTCPDTPLPPQSFPPRVPMLAIRGPSFNVIRSKHAPSISAIGPSTVPREDASLRRDAQNERLAPLTGPRVGTLHCRPDRRSIVLLAAAMATPSSGPEWNQSSPSRNSREREREQRTSSVMLLAVDVRPGGTQSKRRFVDMYQPTTRASSSTISGKILCLLETQSGHALRPQHGIRVFLISEPQRE